MRETSSSDSDPAIGMFSMAIAATAVISFAASRSRRRRSGRSRDGKTRNRKGTFDRELARGDRIIDRDYFCRFKDAQPVSIELEFDRRYRVPREVYEIGRAGVLNMAGYFTELTGALGTPCAKSDQKITAAKRQLSHGVASDGTAVYICLAKSTSLLCLEKNESSRRCIQGGWLRSPNEDEILRIGGDYAALGFPGGIACVDCGIHDAR
jgi:hypothetical protein